MRQGAGYMRQRGGAQSMMGNTREERGKIGETMRKKVGPECEVGSTESTCNIQMFAWSELFDEYLKNHHS